MEGTVVASIVDIDFIKRRESIEELFDDETASFLSIASLHHGFKILNSLTVSAISRYAEFDIVSVKADVTIH
jgi:molybdenum cofactor sulfurtransferase